MIFKKIIKIYSSQIIYLFFISVFIGVIDILSFSILPPALYLAINPTGFKQYFGKYIQINFDFNILIFIIPLLLVLGFIIKFIVVRILTNIQFRILSSKQIQLTNTIFSGLVNEDFDFYNQNNSGHLVKILNNDAGDFRKFSVTLINLFTEISIGVTIVIVLLFQNWIITILLLLVVGLGGWLLEKRKRNKISVYAKKRNLIHKDLFKLLNSTFYGIREIKINKVERFFINIFKNKMVEYYHYHDDVEVESTNSRTLMELIFILFLATLVFASSFFVDQLNFSGYSLLLFLIASLRLLPTLNRISGSVVLLRGLIEIVQNLIFLFEKYSKSTLPIMFDNQIAECNLIKVSNLSFKYSNNTKFIINNLNVCFSKGEIIGIRGASGAGKSTFVNLLVNLYRPTNGDILFIDSQGRNICFDKCSISYLAQETIILDTNLRDNVAFGIEPSEIKDEDVVKALEKAKLDGLLKDMSIYTPIGERGLTLSGGQRQRLSIARMFYKKADIIILDEITSGLDKNTESEIMSNVLNESSNKIIILISHNPNIWEYCSKIIDL